MEAKQHYTAQNRFTPDAGSNGSHRDIGADGCNCGNQQAVGKARRPGFPSKSAHIWKKR